ncbi:hypothetical protein PHLCEN_2v11560 [Hermanssonia centrifuga]|uniref:Uncharacterized protein n=1 Tax=Hermanssonia centrifuga TaxID=98765 RepID=A0A2R6NJL3_9APHY|nr:hypothetical protein PHLCEN_2v11560 [Hermanssonia centrifuga]
MTRLKRTATLRGVSIISRRIHGWSWQAFPIGMGTGAVYLTLIDLTVPPFKALTTIETLFYFLTIALFLLNTSTLLLQFLLYPRQAKRLITTPSTGIFVPLILELELNRDRYRRVYVALSVVVCFSMLMIWYNKPHDLNTFTPAWAFLTGFLDGNQANGAFVACGPPGFTALALLSLGEEAQAMYVDYGDPGEIWYVCSIVPALMLLGLAIFFFLFGILPYWFKLHKQLDEILGFGWILALRKLGQIFQTSFFNVWNTVMTIIMCITWIVLFVLTCVAFWEGKIFISANEDTIQDGRHVNWRLRKHAEDVELGRRPDVEQPIDSGVHSVDLLIPTPETTIPDPKHITATLCTG